LGIDYGAYTDPLYVSYQDLRPVTVSLSTLDPGQLVYGRPATATLRSRVANRGNTAVESFSVSFWDAEVLLVTQVVTGLPPRYRGDSIVEVLWTDVITSPRTFRVVVDSGADVDESCEENNEASTILDIDLSVQPVCIARVGPVPPGETTDITVTTRLSNLGDVTVKDVEIELWSGDGIQRIGATNIPVLSPGQLKEVPIIWADRPVGAHPVKAIVDPRDLVTESDEHNNESRGTAFVPAARAYVPWAVSAHPPE
jgi:subtilase family serine protease